MTVCCEISTVSINFSESTMHNDYVVSMTDACPIFFFLRRKHYVHDNGSDIALFLNDQFFMLCTYVTRGFESEPWLLSTRQSL